MLTAVQEEQHAEHRQRARSAASGAVFSVPMLPAVFDLQSVPTPTVAACPAAPAAAAALTASPPTAGPDLSALLGRSVGGGQCVALVRAAHPSLGPSSTWAAGGPVQGNTALRPGTPIATFDPGNRYANATDGSSHAAIYLGQDAHGLLVLDQWAGSSAAVRTIPWTNPSGVPANTGAAFRVVQAG